MDVTNVFPDDFKESFERTSTSNTKKRQPVLIIPGVCGSKLVARNKITKTEEYAWINTSFIPFSPSAKAAQYLWGYNDQNLVFTSYLKDYVDINAIPGVKGCDRLLDMGVLDIKFFENVNIGKYFGPLIQFLQSELGYKIGVDLFAFSYDWRQSPHIDLIQNQLHQLIQEIRILTNQKVQIIAHSMGGVVTDTYIKLHPKTWSSDISKLIALAVPFDGCGGFSLEALLMGYTLRLPVPKSSAKGMQATCGSAVCLHQKKKGFSPTTPCVYIKKLDDETDQIKQDNIYQKLKSKLKTNKDQLELKIEFNSSLYLPQEIPDISFIIAQKCYLERGVEFQQAKDIYYKLQKCSKRGSIIINGDIGPIINSSKTASFLHSPDQVFENDFKKGVCSLADISRNDFQWECYSVWSEEDNQGRQYQFENKNIQFQDNVAEFDQVFYDILSQQSTELVESKELKLQDYAQQLQYYKEFSQQYEPIPQNITSNSPTNNCMNKQFIGQYGPWSSKYQRQQVTEQSIFSLLQKVHPDNSFESFLFKPSKRLYQELGDARDQNIIFPETSDFKFYSISGFGIDTPMHLVYSKPVNNYQDLLNQKPEYIHVDGDGTVFLTGALGDDFPDEISTRISLKNVGHFQMIMEKNVWQKLSEWLE